MPNTAPREALKPKQLHIAVGLIRAPNGLILISKRREGTPGAGLWEFPGGKCEADETIQDALKRELQEELGIEVAGLRPLIRIQHAYPDRHVLLDTWLVSEWGGTPAGLEGQELAWVTGEQLTHKDLLPANRPLMNAARLPDRYLITPPSVADPDDFLARLRRALAQGLRLVRLRAPDLNDQDYAALAQACLPLCRSADAQLLLDRGSEMVAQLGAHGLHLTSRQLMALTSRPVVKGWLAASCHNREELRQAQAVDCDFAVLGAIESTTTHPHITSLGWPRAAELIDAANMPVYCIGGMTPSDLPTAFAAGAQGIAAIRSLWLE